MISVIKMRFFSISTIICILFLFCLPCFAQDVLYSNNASLYNSDVIPSSDSYAVITYTLKPTNNWSEMVDVKILPFVNRGDLISGPYGWYTYANPNNRSDGLTWYSVLDSTTIYGLDRSLTTTIQSSLNSYLLEMGLGTVQQRRNYINLIKSSILVSPSSFIHFIKPWVVIGFAIFLSLPMWWVIKRALR